MGDENEGIDHKQMPQVAHEESFLMGKAIHFGTPITMTPFEDNGKMQSEAGTDEIKMTTNELHRLLVEWNDTEVDSPRDLTIPLLFAEQARACAESTALLENERRLTFEETDRFANNVAHYLREHGIRAGDHVGIAMDRSIESIIGLLGILKAEAAYVPIDPHFPPERVAYILRDAEISQVLTQQKYVSDLSIASVELIAIDQIWDTVERQSDVVLETGTVTNSVALVIYTSGSTGKPKGVLATHEGAINRFAWMWREYPFDPDEVCCHKTSISFIDSVWEIFGPLLQGIPLVIVPDQIVRDPNAFIDALAEARVSRIVLVPSLLRILLDSTRDLRRRLPDLRIWISSGETLPLELFARFQRALPDCKLLNLYGSSEVSADVTWYDPDRHGPPMNSVPIGRPISNTRLYVLDTNQRVVPIGKPGELYVGGVGLAHGYLNLPELTNERFISDPFSNDPLARLFRTGDRVQYTQQGYLEYLGRIDNQVKIRGIRIELEEIEATLLRFNDVAQAVVVVHDFSKNDPRLIAYLVGRDGKQISLGDLRAQVAQQLPDVMVPSAFVVLNALPFTVSGKVDRIDLASRDLPHRYIKGIRMGPRDIIELRLVEMWEELLGITSIDVRENFFDLGGHSLLAAQLLAQVREEFHVGLPVDRLLQSPTIEEIALQIRQFSAVNAPVSPIPLQIGNSRLPLFCFHAIGGNLLSYPKLVRYLPRNQTIWGLQSVGLDSDAQPFSSIEDIAEQHVSLLCREVQQTGPFALVGFSFGGIVAFEVAQRLRAMGRIVEMLCILDTDLELDQSKCAITDPLGYMIRMMFGNTPPASLVDIRHRPPDEQIALLSEEAIRAQLQLPASGRVQLGRFLGVLRSNIEALFAYTPRPYQGQIILCRAAERGDESKDPTLGWGNLAGGELLIHDVPGTHDTILHDPNVKVLAECIRPYLDRSGQ